MLRRYDRYMDSVSGVGVVDKSAAILDALATRGPLSLAELVEATGISRPTAHRLAVALAVHGLVGRDDDGRFRLGLRLLAWGTRAAAPEGLVERARPVLARLRDESDESAQLYVRDGERRVCVAVAERPTGLRDTVAVGASLPLDAGSGGTVLLAWASSSNEGLGEFAAIRARGWVESVAEREVGVASVSAPVLDSAGVAVAAVSVSGPIERLGRRPGGRLAEPVVAAARALERAAGTR
jgi:DNA-binding IclR family transcriptional regulator